MTEIAYIFTGIQFGGSEKVSLTFLRNVDRRRFDIHPILLVRPWEQENFFISKLEEMGYNFKTIPVAIRPPCEGGDYLRVFRCLRNLYSILSKRSFDLVHSHGYFADIIGAPVSKFLRIPHISTCHGFISNNRNLKIYNRLDKFSLRFCDRIIAVSEGIREDLLKSGIRESRITVIQNAVENESEWNDLSADRIKKRADMAMKTGEYAVGYVGRLSDEKGVDCLIKAAKILKENGDIFKVLIIGDGPKKGELENLTKEMGLEKEIIFVGFQRDVEKWLPALDIFVLPSLTEGTPVALLEAMSFGIPAVATRVGNVPTIIQDGVNGLLINPGDARALAEKLVTLQRSPALCQKLSKEARETVEMKYNVKNWCEKIETQYDLLLQKVS